MLVAVVPIEQLPYVKVLSVTVETDLEAEGLSDFRPIITWSELLLECVAS